MSKFKLSSYVNVARSIADKNNVTTDEGLKMFIANLAVMREYYEGADRNFDYGALGQQWNSLSSTERNSQIHEAEIAVNKPKSGGVQL